MTTALKRRRGTDANHGTFTGLEGEITVNTTNKSLHVHDGTTAGGQETMRTDFDNAEDISTSLNVSGINKITFNTDDLEINASGGYGQIEGQTRVYTKVNGTVISEANSSGLTVANLHPTTTTIPYAGDLKFSTYANMDISSDDLQIRTTVNGGAINIFSGATSLWTGTTTTNRTEKVYIGTTLNQFKTHATQFLRYNTVAGSNSYYNMDFFNQSAVGYGAFIRFTNAHQYYSPIQGYIGSNGASSAGVLYICGPTKGLAFESSSVNPCNTTGQDSDNTVSLGTASARFDDAYVTNGVTTGSDRNLKQDIEQLSDAEQRVAVACKGLIRKYRWRDAFEAKGEEARIHIGIIAQDLEDAFTAEGLDPARYGMFCQDTYWWKEETVPEQEETYVDENNMEQTRTIPERTERKTYWSESDAPDGSTEVTIRSVRYVELLAFIISAM